MSALSPRSPSQTPRAFGKAISLEGANQQPSPRTSSKRKLDSTLPTELSTVKVPALTLSGGTLEKPTIDSPKSEEIVRILTDRAIKAADGDGVNLKNPHDIIETGQLAISNVLTAPQQQRFFEDRRWSDSHRPGPNNTFDCKACMLSTQIANSDKFDGKNKTAVVSYLGMALVSARPKGVSQ